MSRREFWIVTGSAREGDRERAIEAGCDQFFASRWTRASWTACSARLDSGTRTIIRNEPPIRLTLAAPRSRRSRSIAPGARSFASAFPHPEATTPEPSRRSKHWCARSGRGAPSASEYRARRRIARLDEEREFDLADRQAARGGPRGGARTAGPAGERRQLLRAVGGDPTARERAPRWYSASSSAPGSAAGSWSTARSSAGPTPSPGSGATTRLPAPTAPTCRFRLAIAAGKAVSRPTCQVRGSRTTMNG